MATAPISRYADITGDGTGEVNAIGNYSDAGLGLTTFQIVPGITETFEVQRMIVYIRTVGIFNGDKYGNAIDLTNGIIVKVTQDTPADVKTTKWDVTAGQPILINSHWKKLCHDEIPSQYGLGQAQDSMTYRYTFSKDGKPLILSGVNNDKLEIILNDDFSDLEEHNFRIGMKSI